MVQKGSFPSPAPWSAAAYAANFAPLTAAGGGGPYLSKPPDTRFYVIEYDSSGHVWVAPPGTSARRSTRVRASTPRGRVPGRRQVTVTIRSGANMVLMHTGRHH